MENGTDLTVQIKGVVNKGVIAYVEGIRGFIPASKLSLSYVENLEEAVVYAIQLGARQADEQYFRTSRTMFDPAGHPFCLDTEEAE